MKRYSYILLIVIILLLALSTGCSSDNPSGEGTRPDENIQIELTLEELGSYNGKGGQPAYIAVDGIIYDVSEESMWQNGMHNGFEAGKDLTTEIKEVSPHGVSKVKGVPEIGVIVE